MSQERYTQLPSHIQNYVSSLAQAYKFNPLDGTQYAKALEEIQKLKNKESGSRPNFERDLQNHINVLNNVGSYLLTGKYPQGGPSVFDAPNYQLIPGYR